MSDVSGGHMDVGDSLFGWFFFPSRAGLTLFCSWLRASVSSSITSLLIPARHRDPNTPPLHCKSHTCIQGLDQKLHLHMHMCAQLFHFPRNLLSTNPTWRAASFHDVTCPPHNQSLPLTAYRSLKFKSSTLMFFLQDATKLHHFCIQFYGFIAAQTKLMNLVDTCVTVNISIA